MWWECVVGVCVWWECVCVCVGRLAVEMEAAAAMEAAVMEAAVVVVVVAVVVVAVAVVVAVVSWYLLAEVVVLLAQRVVGRSVTGSVEES